MTGSIMSMKNSNETSKNRNRALTAYSSVLQRIYFNNLIVVSTHPLNESKQLQERESETVVYFKPVAVAVHLDRAITLNLFKT